MGSFFVCDLINDLIMTQKTTSQSRFSQVLTKYLIARKEEVMASYWLSQRPILAASHKKPDQTRQAQDGGCHDWKPLTNKEGQKSFFQEIPAPSNEFSTPSSQLSKKDRNSNPRGHSSLACACCLLLLVCSLSLILSLTCIHTLRVHSHFNPLSYWPHSTTVSGKSLNSSLLPGDQDPSTTSLGWAGSRPQSPGSPQYIQQQQLLVLFILISST